MFFKSHFQPIHCACLSNRESVLQLLVENYGVDPRACTLQVSISK